MKNLLLVLTLGISLIFSCKKQTDDPVTPGPEKVFNFPLTIKQYKIEPEGPIKVYIKTGYNQKTEIAAYNPAIIQEKVFQSYGASFFNSIKFESKDRAGFYPGTINNQMVVSKSGDQFNFTLTVGNNTSCHATGTGDYDDLHVDCQAYAIYSISGQHWLADYLRDPCFVNQALDCYTGDTIAILNYKLYLKQE